MRRHDLVEISNIGREKVYMAIKDGYDDSPYLQGIELDLLRDLLVKGYHGVLIPGIVRREEEKSLNGKLAVGFASPYLHDGRRLRIPAIIDRAYVEKTVTPYELLERDWVPRNSCLKALKEIKDESLARGLKLGVWGSAGMEVFTGLYYTHGMSDLDLLIEEVDYDDLIDFSKVLEKISSKHDCPMDMEVSLLSGYGIKLSELLMKTESIMGKGLKDVVLIPRKDVLKSLGK